MDGRLQLGITPRDDGLRVIVDFDVRSHAFGFDSPLAVYVEEAAPRGHEAAAVDQGGVSQVPTRPPQVLAPTRGPTPLKRKR